MISDAEVLRTILQHVMRRDSATLDSRELFELSKDLLLLNVDSLSCASIVERISTHMDRSHPSYKAAFGALWQVRPFPVQAASLAAFTGTYCTLSPAPPDPG